MRPQDFLHFAVHSIRALTINFLVQNAFFTCADSVMGADLALSILVLVAAAAALVLFIDGWYAERLHFKKQGTDVP